MATKYLLASATGSGNGNDWTNAYTTAAALIAGLSRGDTAYIGDGSYSSITFSTANSGTTVITVKKATASDHGTETGWDSSFGDGQAQFSAFTFSSDYWIINGQTGGGPGAWNSGYGFYVYNASSILCSFPASRSNISVSHVDFNSTRTNFCAGIKGVAGASNLTFSHCAIRNIFGPVFHIGSWTGCTMEYLYCYYNRSTPEEHAEGVSSIGTNSNLTWRWSIWDRIEGTAVFAGVNEGESVGWKIYGNVFSRSTTAIYYYYEDPPSTNRNPMRDSYFVNNTIYDMPNTSQGNLVIQSGSGNVAYNNLYYNNIANSFANYMTHNYSFASDNRRTEGGIVDKDSEVVSGEANGQISSGSPFVSYNADPLLANLAAITNAGLDTGAILAENDVDWNGVTRGAPTIWSRGAVQLNPPAAPSGLTTTADGSTSIDLVWTDNSSDETGFKIERSTDGVTFVQIATVGAGVTSYSDTGLAGGVTYYYRVRAYNDNGNSAYSNTDSATTDVAPVLGSGQTPVSFLAVFL